MNKLYIVALFHFKENHLNEAVALLETLVYATHKEEGCMQYDLVEDADNKGVFFIMEVWQTADHHLKHSASDHLAEFRKNAAPLLESSTEVYRGSRLF